VSTNHISEKAKATVVKFCMQVGYVKSHHENDKSPLKGRGQGYVTHYKFWDPPMMSLERLKLESSNFVQR